MSFVYLASPYTHKKREVMMDRHHAASVATAQLLLKGAVVFSPIVHCHEIALEHQLPTDFAFWQNYCLGMLEKASELIVLMLPDWEESVGVQAEIEYALSHDIPVTYVKDNLCA